MRVPLRWLRRVRRPAGRRDRRAGGRRPRPRRPRGGGDPRRRTSPVRSSSAGCWTSSRSRRRTARRSAGARSTSATHDEAGDGAVPRGIVCGARNFVVGDLVVVVPARAPVLPGGLRDRRAQDLRARLRRHDLLGPRARPRRRPRRHHPARHVGLATRDRAPTRSRCSAWTRRRSRSTSRRTAATPSPCAASPASTRSRTGAGVHRPGGPRGARAAGRRLRRPDRRRSTDPRRRRAATGTWPGSCAASTRPRATPRWMQRRLRAGRDAADLARGRRHQLRDARPRAAAARLRPRQAARRRSSSAGRGRASGSPRWTTSSAVLDPEDLLITDGGRRTGCSRWPA